MNADVMLDELAGVGILLAREGKSIVADMLPGANLAPHVDRITVHKAELLAALDLRARIIAVVTVPPEQFDRAEYNQLWPQLHDLENSS